MVVVDVVELFEFAIAFELIDCFISARSADSATVSVCGCCDTSRTDATSVELLFSGALSAPQEIQKIDRNPTKNASFLITVLSLK
jgi:hypothetical protein